jgi:hypothetical protein
MAKLLNQKGVKQEDVLSGLDVNQIQDSKAISNKLKSMGISDPDDEIATTMAHSNVNAISFMKETYAPDQYTTARVQISKALLNQFPQDAKDAEQRDKDGIKTQLLASVMSSMSGNQLTPGNAFDSAGKVETEAKAIAKARAKLTGGSDEVTQDDTTAAINKVVGNVISAPKLERLIEASTMPGKDGKTRLSRLAETLYNVRKKAQKAGEDPEDVNAKVDAALEFESKNMGLDLSKEDYEAAKEASEKAGETKPGDVPAGSGSANAAPIIDIKMLTAALQDSIGKAVIAKLDDVLKAIPVIGPPGPFAPSKGLFSTG